MDISEIIEEWYESSGGTGLPEVSAEDNGDVLTVVNGEWNKAEPAGGDPNVVIIGIFNPAPNYFRCTHTLEEMVELINSGHFLVLKTYNPDNPGVVNYTKNYHVLSNAAYDADSGKYSLSFTESIMGKDNNILVCTIHEFKVEYGADGDVWSSYHFFVQPYQV